MRIMDYVAVGLVAGALSVADNPVGILAGSAFVYLMVTKVLK